MATETPAAAVASEADPVLFLLDAASAFEEQLLASHTRSGAGDAFAVAIPPSRRRPSRVSLAGLEAALASAQDDPLLAPLRVAWLPPLRDGERSARFSDLLSFGDPRDPGLLRQRWIQRRAADRVHIIEGEPARLSELRERWRASGGSETGGLAQFVARQAALALERAERKLRGARYKVPRFVHDEILRRPVFRAGIARLARAEGAPEQVIQRRAARALREIAATHSRFVIDLVARLIHLMYTRGYGERLVYDRDELNRLAQLSERHPVVFLPTHKSNLDHLVLQYALHENGLPPNHTAGGINMNFFPVGTLIRRSGVFFIRRSFRDDEVYKHVLRSYIDYLIEKRFPLEWYIEGGRSRSGKLLPPRFGLLAYVLDAYRRGCSEDVLLIPVSIAYDQIIDVGSYTREQRGGAKSKESLGWFLKFLRGLGRQHGDIHIHFGDSLSLREALGPPPATASSAPEEASLDLQKLAFEVSVRINKATPVTPTSLVTLALLGVGDRALSVGETGMALYNLLRAIDERKLPVTPGIDELRSEQGVRAALETLVESGVVTCFDEGAEPVYRIGVDQELTAAYYRNTIVHFFVVGGIVELALLAASEPEAGDRVQRFWTEAMALRDLLKFEFFFADKPSFRAEIRTELDLQIPNWETALREGGPAIEQLVWKIRPFSSHRALRPFLESYRIMAERLASWEPGEEVDAERLVDDCMGLGKQYRLQHRIHSTDSISKVLFRSALDLARNRGLLEPGGAARRGERLALVAELADGLRRTETIAGLAAARRGGWIH
jgi:glycerol-3-phosphate O-acyltransferase